MGTGAHMDHSPCSGCPAPTVVLALACSRYRSVLRGPSKARGREWALGHGDWSRASTYLPSSECGARGRKLLRIIHLVADKPVVSVGV